MYIYELYNYDNLQYLHVHIEVVTAPYRAT